MKKIVTLSLLVFLTFACSFTATVPNTSGSPTSGSLTPSDQQTQIGQPTIPDASLTQNLKLGLLSNNVQKGVPDNGWINYSLDLALRNDYSSSIQIYASHLSSLALGKGLPSIVINSENSYIETQEGVTYPTIVENLVSKIIPPGLLIKGFPEPIVFRFRVAEKLTPTTLVISPGIAFIPLDSLNNYLSNNIPIPFIETSVDIYSDAISLLPNENKTFSQQQIRQINLSEAIVADIPGDLSAKFNVGMGSNDLNVKLSIPITNNDITQDQKFNINALLVDQFGYQYSNDYCSDGFFDKVGPGQTKIFNICFKLPPDSARLPRVLFLTYYWDDQEETYMTNLNNLASCDSSTVGDFMDNMNLYNKKSTEEINVPGEVSITGLNPFENNGSIWTVHTPPGKDILITLIISNGVRSSADMNIIGPDGLYTPQTAIDISGSPNGNKEARFYSFCDGLYYFVIWNNILDYKIITQIEGQ